MWVGSVIKSVSKRLLLKLFAGMTRLIRIGVNNLLTRGSFEGKGSKRVVKYYNRYTGKI